jgi:hypothetical protein
MAAADYRIPGLVIKESRRVGARYAAPDSFLRSEGRDGLSDKAELAVNIYMSMSDEDKDANRNPQTGYVVVPLDDQQGNCFLFRESNAESSYARQLWDKYVSRRKIEFVACYDWNEIPAYFYES